MGAKFGLPHRPRAFENRVLRNISGYKLEELI
jgi:hypothetical protein